MGGGWGRSSFINKYCKRGYFLAVNYFWDLLLTHNVSKNGKFQYFVTLISFQWPATRNSRKNPYWKLCLWCLRTPCMVSQLDSLNFLFPDSPRRGLGFQNGCSQAEVTESLSPHVSTYSPFPHQAERLNLNAELLLTCCRLQLKMNPSWQQFAI